jgi:phage shock protein PspC (stress-responsive transcriptional regulator)
MTSPITPQPSTPRKFTRSSSDKVAGGVAGGLADYFGIDPILVRVAFVVLALAGGAGVAAYVGLWVFVPDDRGVHVSPGLRSRPVAIAGAAIVGAAILFSLPGDSLFSIGPIEGLITLALVGGVAYLIIGASRDHTGAPSIGRALMITGAVAVAGAAGIGAAVGAAFGGGVVVAGLVIAAGLALVVSAFSGGRRWLILPAIALALPLAAVTAADLRFEGGVGDREYRPASVNDIRGLYKLGAGELVLDLRDVDFPAGRTTINVELGMGDLKVRVPDDVCVGTDVKIGMGDLEVFGRQNDGIAVDWTEKPANPADAPEVFIDADVDLGAVQIGDRVRRGSFRFGDLSPGENRNTGCLAA